MTEKNKKLLKYILLILCGILITGAIAGVLYGRHLFSLIGSAQEPVPTLSEEEEKMLLGTTEALETTVPETTVPEEPQPTWTEETKSPTLCWWARTGVRMSRTSCPIP